MGHRKKRQAREPSRSVGKSGADPLLLSVRQQPAGFRFPASSRNVRWPPGISLGGPLPFLADMSWPPRLAPTPPVPASTRQPGPPTRASRGLLLATHLPLSDPANDPILRLTSPCVPTARLAVPVLRVDIAQPSPLASSRTTTFLGAPWGSCHPLTPPFFRPPKQQDPEAPRASSRADNP